MDLFRGAVAQKPRVQRLKYTVSPHQVTNRHSQRFPRVLVQDGQHLVTPIVVELVVHEVDGPDVIGMGRAQPDDQAVLVIELSALSMPPRQRKALFAQDPLNLLVVHLPAFDMQQLGNLTIAVAPILLRQPDKRQPQSIVIFGVLSILQGASRQTNHPAGPFLRRRKLLARMDNGFKELSGRQDLGFR